MQRSLIQLSPSTAVVSLPAPWIERNKLKKGAKLEMTENENSIIISATGSKSAKEITIDISAMPKRNWWMMIDAAYTAGYDTIKVITGTTEAHDHMHTAVKYFPGMIIDEERKGVVVFRDMVLESSTDLQKLLGRIFNSTAVIFEESFDAMTRKEWTVLTGIKKRDYNINMYIALCLRHISKYGFTPFSKTGTIYAYIKMLEMLADKACTLIIGMGERKENGKPEQRLLQDLLLLYRQAYKLHLAYSIEKLLAFESARQKMLADMPKVQIHARIYATEILELFFEMEELEAALHI